MTAVSIEYAIYERRDGRGPAFLCRPLVNGKERMIFNGTTAEAAENAARTWCEKNFGPRPAPKSKKTTDAADEPTDVDLFS